MLQHPIMLILNEEAGQKGLKIVSMQSAKPVNDTSESIRMLNSVLNLTQFNDEYRFNCFYSFPFWLFVFIYFFIKKTSLKLRSFL